MKSFIPRNMYVCLLSNLAILLLIAGVGALRIRLAGSIHDDRGRVEVYYRGQWGTVCDDRWDDIDATVFCKHLGYRMGKAYGSAFFGQGTGNIWLDEIRCTSYLPIERCRHSGWGVEDCSHSEDAGVHCYNNLSWSGWSSWTECSVTCGDGIRSRTRRCDDPVSAADVTLCTGSSQDQESCSNGISCTGRDVVRLAGSGEADRGRVEVYHNSQWGTICDDRWDNTDATVVCKTLGFSFGKAMDRAHFGSGSGRIWMDEVRCSSVSITDIKDCRHSGWGTHDCSHSEDAGVICADDISWGDWTSWTDCSVTCGSGVRTRTRNCDDPIPAVDVTVCAGNPGDQESCSNGISCTGRDVVRLAGSGEADRGRVEVYHNSQWGTICDDKWDNTDATVVCKTLGFRNGKAMNGAHFGSGSGTIWMDNVDCASVSATDIKNCQHSGWGTHDCSHSEDAGVICADDISWGDWTSWTDCSVTCGSGVRTRTRNCDDPFPAVDVTVCAGNPGDQESCSNGISCTGRDVVRLVGSGEADRGRVEVYHNSQWGTICDDGWDNRDATVVCKTLGFRNGKAMNGAHFGSGSGTIWMDNIDCASVSATDIKDCQHSGWGKHDCSHSEDAGVICVDEISWGDWTSWTDCSVTCGSGVKTRTRSCDDPIPAANVTECAGNSQDQTACLNNFPCTGPAVIRLVGTRYADRGRVEVYHNGQWGTVCDDDWDDTNAAVVCKTLGYKSGEAFLGAHFGAGSGQIWMDDVDCSTGAPMDIRECEHDGWGTTDCSHSEDAGVRCYNDIRLKGSNRADKGRVEVYHNNQWGSICNNDWDNADATVVCRMLGYSSGRTDMHTDYGTGINKVWLDSVNCSDGSPTNIKDCSHRGWGTVACRSIDYASVQCISDCKEHVDLAFVIDESGSVGKSNFRQGLTFIKKVIDVYEIARNKSRVSALTFGSSYEIHFNFDRYDTKSSVVQAIQRITYGSSGSTYTAGALNAARNILFTSSHGDRPDVQNVCVVLTDGISDSRSQTIAAAAKLKDTGTHVFSIGIGSSVKEAELKGIASTPAEKYYLQVDNYNTLQTDQLSELVSNLVCEAAGTWNNWREWSPCSVTCGGGTQQRRRACAEPSGTRPCEGDRNEHRQCNPEYCPIAGLWGRWSQWSDCSTTCGNGRQQRSRRCNNPPPSYGGPNCVGPSNGDRPCSAGIPCPVDGGWNQWSGWSSCSVTCANGTQERSRDCNDPAPMHGGRQCSGLANTVRKCDTAVSCPVDGGWSQWSGWSRCSVTCAIGTQERSRDCNDPVPLHGGRQCSGLSKAERKCDTRISCPVDGRWNQWSEWSRCSVTCANGTQERSRDCNNPPPMHGGRQCSGLTNVIRKCDTAIPCPIDGGWSQWSGWSMCSVTCANGTQTRSRDCNNPVPMHGGRQCAGLTKAERKCNTEMSCPVDGGWSQWSGWSRCSVTCASGTQQKSRDCNDPVPMHGGRQCLGLSKSVRRCDTAVPCPVDGGWSLWSGWSKCSVTCANGIQDRSRNCNNPIPMHGGRQCAGLPKTVRKCDTAVPCPVDGGWSLWSGWSKCSVTCANGTQERLRKCNDPVPVHGGRPCAGLPKTVKKCDTAVPCPVDGGWSLWSGWSKCSVTCANGTQERSRDCNNPVPMHGGRQCAGLSQSVKKCDTAVPCPIDGEWSQWSGWSKCSVTCANGTQDRSRNCNNPIPMHGGRQCAGLPKTVRECDTAVPCPVDGGWSQWSGWSKCSVTCANGTQDRSRNCNDPIPMHGGKQCAGLPKTVRECDTAIPCPVDGEWNQWSGWSKCSVTCANGTQERLRKCNDPVPMHGGRQCVGLSKSVKKCDTAVPCPVDGGWSLWSGWSKCSVTCANGTQERSRDCNNPIPMHGGRQCAGVSKSVKKCDTAVPCPVDGSWSNWSDWTSCSVTCSTGTQKRTRVCDDPAPMHGGKQCSGKALSQKICDTSVPCPIDGSWSSWSDWTPCSVTCSTGIQKKSRVCNDPTPMHGGKQCSGEASSQKICDTSVLCPIDGGWGTWSDWSACSVTCGTGTQQRSRDCDNPVPAHGGSNCSGKAADLQKCDSAIHCPVDGSWTIWSEWSSCSVTCDDGFRERRRNCTNPPPQHGGDNCHGNNSEAIVCEARVLCPGSCAKNEFKCHSSTPQNKQCVPVTFKCDSFPDCADNSDENETECGIDTRCPEGQFKCDNEKCVKPGAECDGHKDCTDGSDESPELCSSFDYY